MSISTKIKTILITIIVATGISLQAQGEESTSSAVADSLHFMVGEWEGTGWMMTRTGRQTSEVRETVSCKLNEVHGHSSDKSEIIPT